MSENIILIIAGVVIFVVGLAKLRSNQTGGFNLRNFGITIGGTNTQTNRVGNVAPGGSQQKARLGRARRGSIGLPHRSRRIVQEGLSGDGDVE